MASLTQQSSSSKSGRSSPEYVTIRKCYQHIVSVVKESYGTIGDSLFSGGYIASALRDYIRMDSKTPIEKAQRLVDAIIDRVEHDPDTYHGFVEILDEQGSWTNILVKKLRELHISKSEGIEHSDDTSSESEDSFHSASELNETLPYQQVASSQKNDIATPSSRESSSTNRANLELFPENAHTRTRSVTGFVCPYCEKCTVKEFFSKTGCPGKADSSVAKKQPMFPYLNTQMISERDRQELEAMLFHDTREIIKLFAATQDSIAASLNAKTLAAKTRNAETGNPEDEVIVKRIVAYVLKLVAVSESLDAEDKKTIKQAKCVFDIFLGLDSYISFFNYEILESLAVRFGSSEDKECIEKYIVRFNRFCERSVFEVPPNVFRNSDSLQNSDDRLFSVKYFTQATPLLGDIKAVCLNIAQILNISVWDLQLCSIEEGCVCLRFCIAAIVADEALPVSQSQKVALDDIGVRIQEQADDTPTGENHEAEKLRYDDIV